MKKPKVPNKVEEISTTELFKLAATIALSNKSIHLMNQERAIGDIQAIYATLVKSLEVWK